MSVQYQATPIKNPVAWQSYDVAAAIADLDKNIDWSVFRRPRELDLLGAATLRRDGWRRVGLHWARGAGDNPIPESKTHRFAEREPMNRRRRARRRKGLDTIPAGHQLIERKIITARVSTMDKIDQLAIDGDPRTLVYVKPRVFPSEILRSYIIPLHVDHGRAVAHGANGVYLDSLL